MSTRTTRGAGGRRHGLATVLGLVLAAAAGYEAHRFRQGAPWSTPL